MLAPCGLILENCNLEKMHHVMQKKQIKNAKNAIVLHLSPVPLSTLSSFDTVSSLRLTLFNIFFRNCYFRLSQTCIFQFHFFCNCHLCLSQTCIVQSHFFLQLSFLTFSNWHFSFPFFCICHFCLSLSCIFSIPLFALFLHFFKLKIF